MTSGVIGCTLGGIVTDYLRRVDWMNSVQAALLVETVAHVIATPIMVMVLTLEAPYCFIGIFIYPIFSEMWMGVYLIGRFPHLNLDNFLDHDPQNPPYRRFVSLGTKISLCRII